MPEWIKSKPLWAGIIVAALTGGFAAGIATDDVGRLAELATAIVRLLGGG